MTRTKPHTGHEMHLCAMVEENGLSENMKPLVKNAEYVCMCCGRAAKSCENLCSPESI